jgi:hypothetical protein
MKSLNLEQSDAMNNKTKNETTKTRTIKYNKTENETTKKKTIRCSKTENETTRTIRYIEQKQNQE